MNRKIFVEVDRYGGAYLDDVYVSSLDLEKTIKELYLNQGFGFEVTRACYKVTDLQVEKVKKLLGV